MLIKKHRLIKERDFIIVYKRGQIKKNDFFILRYGDNFKSYSRWAVIVSKKISNQAVKRNRLRRQIKEIISANLTQIKKNSDIIISLKKLPSTDNFLLLKEQLEKLLKTADFL